MPTTEYIDLSFMQHPGPFNLTFFMAALRAPGAVVLDLGCGTGRNARALLGAGTRVHAFDMDTDALETARALLEAPERFFPSAGRVSALPFRDEVFDAVLCADVLHWSADRGAFDAAWDEAWRVLRPGGIFGARLPCLDFNPGARPVGNGRFRLASGAEWFLADLEVLEEKARDAEWLEPPADDGGGAARFLLRKAP